MPDRPEWHFGDADVQAVDFKNAGIVILPLCYESAPSYGAGAGKGPYHILDASAQLERIDEETLFDWGDLSLHTLPAVIPDADPDAALGQMKAAAEQVLRARKSLLTLGGDHAVSIGPILAAAEMYPDVGVLQVDAHMDLRDEWNGSRYNHACVMRRVAETAHPPIVQVGIRAFSRQEFEFAQKHSNIHTLYAHQIDQAGAEWIDRAIQTLPQRVYLSIDLDGLDPSVVPGTGTPEPGGLTYRQLVGLIRAVGRSRSVVAADITELAKIEGTQVSEYTAAKIAAKILVHCFRKAS